MRMVDLLSPIGKGQRGMIVSQPKTGKTTLLKQIARSITATRPNMKVIVLLIDERPEEVTDIRESIEGPNAEVIYSTFDELPEHHKRVSEMVLERAKRLVEHTGCRYFIHTLQFILFFQQRMLHHLNKFFIIFCPFEEVKYLLHIFFCAVSGHFSVKGVYNFLFFFG